MMSPYISALNMSPCSNKYYRESNNKEAKKKFYNVMKAGVT